MNSAKILNLRKNVNYPETINLEHAEKIDNNALPKENFELSWNNISIEKSKKISSGFWKRSRHKNVQILNNVSGNVKSGDLLAIMGPSGSGKTTLLATISMRIQGNFSGSILFNRQKVSKDILINISGFVPQQDLAFEMLTVIEHMEFMAKMKMDKNTTNNMRTKCISKLLNDLGLNKCYNSKLAALSGGERKRLSLAVQLINDPPLLFCDEPTTGLDSWTAASVIKQLRVLSSSGKAIICSIHQPASGIIDLFHQVLLLTSGKVAFLGPVDEASAFFKTQGFVPPIDYNEAEFLVSVISDEKQGQKVCLAWDQKKNNNQIVFQNEYNDVLRDQDFCNITDSTNSLVYSKKKSSQNPGMFTQLYWLMWRSLITARRDNKIWLMEFLSLMGIAIIVAVPYKNILIHIDQKDIQNVQGLLYLIVTEIIFLFAYSVLHTFPPEIAILLRELANGLYTPAPYYVSKILLMIPRAVMESFLYTAIIFWIVGLNNTFVAFALFILPVTFAANCANAYGAWLSATFESIATASIISVVIELISYTFSGSFLNLASTPLFWIKYVSMFYYPIEAISILQWEGVNAIKCDEREGLPCIKSGAEVVDYLGFNIRNYYVDLMGLSVLYLFFHLLGYCSLLKRSKRQPVY